MKAGIHPNYEESTVKCACGNTFETKSTKKQLNVDSCSKCHPHYTGKTKADAIGGRVDRFNQRVAAAATTETKKSEAK